MKRLGNTLLMQKPKRFPVSISSHPTRRRAVRQQWRAGNGSAGQAGSCLHLRQSSFAPSPPPTTGKSARGNDCISFPIASPLKVSRRCQIADPCSDLHGRITAAPAGRCAETGTGTRRLARAALLRSRPQARREARREAAISTLNHAHRSRFPNVWKCHIAFSIAPNFCPPINAQFPSEDKAVHYFWLTNSAQGTLIFPRALRGQMLHRDRLRAMTEQARF